MTKNLTKRDLLTLPGGYAAIPNIVLKADISPAAKCVYAALANELGGGRATVNIAIARLAALCSLARRTVQLSLAVLEEKELIARNTTAGKSVEISLLSPPENSSIEPAQNMHRRKKCARAKNAPVQNMRKTSAKFAPPSIKEKKEKNPPTPQGVNCATENLPESKSDCETDSETAELIALWTAEYAKAVPQSQMPANWQRKLSKFVADGEGPVAATVTASAIAATAARCQRDGSKTGFGAGTVMMALRQKLAARKSLATATDQDLPEELQRERQALDDARSEDEARKLAAQAELLAWYRTLPEADRARYVKMALDHPYPPKRADIIEYQAALEAKAEAAEAMQM